MRKRLVLVAGAVVFGSLALASPASANGDHSPSSLVSASSGDSVVVESPGSIGVPTSVEA